MYYFERIEKKLEIALDYLGKLEKYAKEKNKKNLYKSVKRCTTKIKEI